MKQIDLLERVCLTLGLEKVDELIHRFDTYGKLLIEWNQKLNLISRNDEERIVTRHFIESIGFVLTVRFPDSARVIDLGSGAGFPGIPLKLIRPDLRFILVESKKKKVRFLETVTQALDLRETEVMCGRIENMIGQIDPVDVIVSRSVASLEKLVKWSIQLLKPKTGILVTIKGRRLTGEMKRFQFLAEKLKLTDWELKAYNPFPEIHPLDRSTAVIIKNR